MGLGVFIAEAGPNRFAVHQGANDGFRCLFIYCFDGPDRNTGFTILSNSDNNAVLFIAKAAQLLLQELKIEGLDSSKFKSDFNMSEIPQEQIVNLGYEKLVFSAFEPDLPEPIIDRGPPDPLAHFNLAVGGKIISATDQRFARGENLLSDHLPKFDPELYGRQGKIMDSWESVRHNQSSRDDLVFELKNPSAIHYVSFSTKYHLGNQAPEVMLEGSVDENYDWKCIVARTPISGHSLKNVLSENPSTEFRFIRVSMLPDGGLSRLALFNQDLPESEKVKFKPASEAPSLAFDEKIPHSRRPLTPKFVVTPESVQAAWSRFSAGDEIDVASAAFGGKIVSASNEHYGPAAQIISPYPPLNMFDGFESARSRLKGHFENVQIALGRPSKIHRIEADFTFFKNNNPWEFSIDGLTSDLKWVTLAQRINVKAYAGNILSVPVQLQDEIQQIRINVFPDGGMNRIRVFSRK
jgi:allantoicase